MKSFVERTLVLLSAAVWCCGAAFSETPQIASPCQLKSDPAAFNHKLVTITSFVSHGFEDFSLQDPSCNSQFDVWLEYGGKISSGTLYCCGPSSERGRPNQLVVENIPISLVDDETFRTFDRLLQIPGKYGVVHAKLVGRFFSGKRAADGSWTGYGHMGCCGLLVIQQVLSVDPHDRNDLEYEEIDEPLCVPYRILTPIRSYYPDMLRAQEQAEGGDRAWAFDDAERVVADGLAALLKIDRQSLTGMKELHRSQGRVVYEWHPPGSEIRYVMVVSRPYWLSFYSHKEGKVAWGLAAVYEEECSD